MKPGFDPFGSCGSFVSSGGLKGESTACKGSIDLLQICCAPPDVEFDGKGRRGRREEDYAGATNPPCVSDFVVVIKYTR